MKLTSYPRRLLGAKSQSGRSPRPTRRLYLEPLEDRLTPSGGMSPHLVLAIPPQGGVPAIVLPAAPVPVGVGEVSVSPAVVPPGVPGLALKAEQLSAQALEDFATQHPSAFMVASGQALANGGFGITLAGFAGAGNLFLCNIQENGSSISEQMVELNGGSIQAILAEQLTTAPAPGALATVLLNPGASPEISIETTGLAAQGNKPSSGSSTAQPGYPGSTVTVNLTGTFDGSTSNGQGLSGDITGTIFNGTVTLNADGGTSHGVGFSATGTGQLSGDYFEVDMDGGLSDGTGVSMTVSGTLSNGVVQATVSGGTSNGSGISGNITGTTD